MRDVLSSAKLYIQNSPYEMLFVTFYVGLENFKGASDLNNVYV